MPDEAIAGDSSATTAHATPAPAPTTAPSSRASRAAARGTRPSTTITTPSRREKNPNIMALTPESSIHARPKPCKKSREIILKLAGSLGAAAQPNDAPKVASTSNVFIQNGLVYEDGWWVTPGYRQESIMSQLRDDNPSETCNWCGKPWPKVRCEDCRRRRNEFFAKEDCDEDAEVEGA